MEHAPAGKWRQGREIPMVSDVIGSFQNEEEQRGSSMVGLTKVKGCSRNLQKLEQLIVFIYDISFNLKLTCSKKYFSYRITENQSQISCILSRWSDVRSQLSVATTFCFTELEQ